MHAVIIITQRSHYYIATSSELTSLTHSFTPGTALAQDEQERDETFI